MEKRWAVSLGLAIAMVCMAAHAQQMPTMAMGMNVGWNSVSNPECPFIDLMKGASAWLTFHEGSSWDTDVVDSLDVDSNGYPLEIPQTVGGNETWVKFRLPEFRMGRFVFLYDGGGRRDEADNLRQCRGRFRP